MADKPQEKTISDILQVVLIHYKLFFAGFAMFVIGTMVVSLHIPVKYTAKTVFERRSDSATDKLGDAPDASFGVMKFTLEQELCGDEAVEAIAEELGLFAHLPCGEDGKLTLDGVLEKRKLIRNIRTNLLVEWKIQSKSMDQLALKYTDTDSYLAAEIPNRLVERYLVDVNDKILVRLRESRSFLVEQWERGKADLAKLAQAKLEFETANSSVLFLENMGLQTRIQEIQVDIETRYRQKLVAQKKIERYESLLRNSKDIVLHEEIKKLQKKVTQCITMDLMTESHPDVIKLQARIAQLEKQIQNNETTTPERSPHEMSAYESNLVLSLADEQRQLEFVETELVRLENQLLNYQQGLAQSVPIREAYANLLKPLEQQEGKVARWNRFVSEIDMLIASEEANRRTQLQTVSLAKTPYNPCFPPFWTIVGIALGGGLVFGYGLCFIASSMDHSLWTAEAAVEEFAEFDVPVVGVVSEIISPKVKALGHMKRSLVTTVMMLVLIGTLCFSVYCVLLKLESPEHYKGWQNTSPEVAAVEGGDAGELTQMAK